MRRAHFVILNVASDLSVVEGSVILNAVEGSVILSVVEGSYDLFAYT